MKLFKFLLKTSCCVVIGITSVAAQANINPLNLTAAQNSGSPSNGLNDPCKKMVNKYSICMDSLAPNNLNNYTTDTKTNCIINSNYKGTIPPFVKSFCTGSFEDPLGPTGASAIDATVGDKHTPPMVYVNGLMISFGACSTTLLGENLIGLAGTIYSCNQSTGVFTVHR